MQKTTNLKPMYSYSYYFYSKVTIANKHSKWWGKSKS